jgi:hypothetical protein
MNVLSLHTNVPFPTGIFSMGSNIVTARGLIVMGATADDYLRAFNVHDGDAHTYIGADGRQYVVIAADGHGGLRTRSGDAVEALPSPLNSIGRLPRHGTVGVHLVELEGIVLTVAAVCTVVHGKSVTPLMQWCRAAIKWPQNAQGTALAGPRAISKSWRRVRECIPSARGRYQNSATRTLGFYPWSTT